MVHLDQLVVKRLICPINSIGQMTLIFTDTRSDAKQRARGLGKGAAAPPKCAFRPNGVTPAYQAAPLIRTENRRAYVNVTGKLAMRYKYIPGSPVYYH
jgi:hypothetical protein